MTYGRKSENSHADSHAGVTGVTRRNSVESSSIASSYKRAGPTNKNFSDSFPLLTSLRTFLWKTQECVTLLHLVAAGCEPSPCAETHQSHQSIVFWVVNPSNTLLRAVVREQQPCSATLPKKETAQAHAFSTFTLSSIAFYRSLFTESETIRDCRRPWLPGNVGNP